ncbi:hypothetical protein EBB07_24170 [Paenibacillaceae bacterium]|nr:hypothetical protein EBB07_24170 [Paenibacillaceae bacterium]
MGEWLLDWRIQQEVEAVRIDANSDFAALALPIPGERRMMWRYIAGSRDLRILQMKIVPGVGMAGMVLRHGTPWLGTGGEHGGRMDCPVMIAEKLNTAIAFPMGPEGSRSIEGVLLLGRREGSLFEREHIKLLSERILQMTTVMDFEKQI